MNHLIKFQVPNLAKIQKYIYKAEIFILSFPISFISTTIHMIILKVFIHLTWDLIMF